MTEPELRPAGRMRWWHGPVFFVAVLVAQLLVGVVLRGWYLSELIDDYILGKLDERLTTIFKGHLSSCDRCKKEVAFMTKIISEAKKIRNQERRHGQV